MAKLLFSLRGVPADEAEEVRSLLTEQGISFYETDAGNWGVSMPAIWLHHEVDFAQARQLLDEYQQQRQIKQRQLYLQKKQTGQNKTVVSILREQPLLFISYLAVIMLILYVSIKLLFELGLHW